MLHAATKQNLSSLGLNMPLIFCRSSLKLGFFVLCTIQILVLENHFSEKYTKK